MELRQYYYIARRWAWLVVLGAILAGGAAYAFSAWQTPVYQASVTVRISTPNSQGLNDYSALLANQRLAQTYAQLLAEKPVLEGVARNLGLPPGTGVGGVSVQPVQDTELLHISVQHTDPALAQAAANEIPKVFLAQDQALQEARYADLKASLDAKMQEQEAEIARLQREISDRQAAATAEGTEADVDLLESDLQQARSNLNALIQNYGQVELAEAQSGTTVTVVAPADLPLAPVSPRPMQNTMLAAVVGAMLAAGIAFLVEYLDDSLKGPEDIQVALGLPTLGAISRVKDKAGLPLLTGDAAAHSPQAEAFRVLRTNVRFSQVDQPLRSLLITSPNPMEGKSTIAANLSIVIAQAGQRVLLVDSDLRRPRQHKLFDLSNRRWGLTSLLVNGLEAGYHAIRASRVPDLGVLTSGPLPPNPSELLGSKRMNDLLARMKKKADLVILDSPPVLAGADAAVLARQVDGTLLLVEAGKTRRAAAQQALQALDQVGAHVLGVVLNKVDTGNGRYYYYYHSDYHSDNGHGDPAEARVVEKARDAVTPEARTESVETSLRRILRDASDEG